MLDRPLRGVRVLIVEDERLLAAELAERLAGVGAVVVGSADTGAAAIRRAEAQRPEIVLMDIRLKGELDGIETARPPPGRGPGGVVFLSAHTDDATLDRARDAGAYAFLGKPLRDRDVSGQRRDRRPCAPQHAADDGARGQPPRAGQGDPTLLRRLVQNLVANAIKFRRPDGAPQVAIDAHATADGAVEIQVRDNGNGFDPELADRLFERFPAW